jgi:hypothetical protein
MVGPQYELEFLYDDYPDAPSNITVEWRGSWSTYEEAGHAYIFRDHNNLLLLQEWNYSVMTPHNELIWEPTPISEDDAVDFMVEWETYWEQNEIEGW